jgi:hypothetical protein
MAFLLSLRALVLTGFVFCITSLSASASPVTCGDSFRQASLDDALSCTAHRIGHTMQRGDMAAIFGGIWTIVGDIGSNTTNNFLTASGSNWGGSPASGTWGISANFWSTYSFGILTMHVGGGNTNAVDSFEWKLTPGDLQGTFDYVRLAGNGVGLSNLQLWGSGTASSAPVPESSPLFLLFVGLTALGAARYITKR